MIPRDQLVDPALLVAVDDGGERRGQISGRRTRLLPERDGDRADDDLGTVVA